MKTKKLVFSTIVTSLFLFSIINPSSVLAFSEQRKYIGQEYNADTGLDYLNARYYDAKRGQFISQDPLVRDNPEKFLADPQQLNSYAYARNNPINASDPSGLVVVTVSGTTFGLQKSDYLKDSTILQANIHKEFKGQDVLNFSWSGQNNNKARQDTANDFSSYISDTMKNYSSNEPLNLICHSHGCNVITLYTQQQNAHQINNLISFEQPILGQYTGNESKIDNHINVYSNKDQIQNHGGTEHTVTGLIGAALFGVRGGQLGDAIGWGEFGPAGRTIDGVSNIDASGQTHWWRPIRAHSSPYENPTVWSKIGKDVK